MRGSQGVLDVLDVAYTTQWTLIVDNISTSGATDHTLTGHVKLSAASFRKKYGLGRHLAKNPDFGGFGDFSRILRFSSFLQD